eukprot:GHVN01042846.1.p1 GENE.GHVN01042846.1~~GHVN01042846.1.p1  ORF type:complete len:344 (-),score=48.88 GHVN01042846.1:1685-2716(-)
MGTAKRPDWAFKTDNLVEESESVPLFARALPEDIEQHPDFYALHQLAEEGTPDERAQTHKEHGNDFYKLAVKASSSEARTRSLHNAREFYRRGIDIGCTDAALLASLHTNKALVELHLGNHRLAAHDSSLALEARAESPKALLCKARAQHRLGKNKEALESIDALLILGESEAALQLKNGILNGLAIEQAHAQEEERIARIEALMKKKKIAIGPKAHFLCLLEMKTPLSGSLPAISRDQIVWTVLLFNSAYARYELVTDVGEADMLHDHVDALLKAQGWDKEKYKAGFELVFIPVQGDRILIRRGAPFGRVLQGEGIFVSDCYPAFFIEAAVPSQHSMPEEAS